ncbi:Kinesin-like protein unc-104 [Diplonema papillatum]|nr:Kinesin-like protein unc-104 [Diplonema papillatum]
MHTHRTGDLSDTSSRIALVDLAGSERQRAAQTEGERLKEGACINKGLLSLGNVIEALASNSDGKKGKQFTRFVQYRDSTLTWLLREALGGNSKTVMVATLSPSALNYEESLSTLKYADRAKKIQNAVSVNKDSKKQVIFALREEIKMLKDELEQLRACAGVADGCFVQPGSVTVSKEDPYLLQIDPLPCLHDAVLHWIGGSSTCYVSSADHTSARAVTNIEAASAQEPLKHADHTIKLAKSKGIREYHCLFVKTADGVLLYPTFGAAYDGRPCAFTPRPEEDCPEVKVDGMEVVGPEKLASGSHVEVGEYQFIYVDPENVSDCVQFHQRCTRLERERVAADREAVTTAKRVAHLLSEAGLETRNLPTKEEALAAKGVQGEQLVVRTAAGPAVFVWEGSTEAGCWRPATAVQAELGAAALVDKMKNEVETGRRLAAILSGTVQLEELPDIAELAPPTGKTDRQAKHLVRSKETGVKVVEYDQQLKRWVTVPEAVAELTARAAADDVEKRRRAEAADAFKKEIQAKVTDLDDAKRQLAETTAAHGEQMEMSKKELSSAKNRISELERQLAAKESMIQQHANSQSLEISKLKHALDDVTQEYEQKSNRSEHIIQQLEESYASTKYEFRKSESLLETTLATKQKAVEQANHFRQDLQQAILEQSALKTEKERLETLLSEQGSVIAKLQKEIAEADELRRESASGETKQVQQLLDAKEAAHHRLVEEKEQLDGNLRRLSKHYLTLQEELQEQQSRLADYREQLEAEQEQRREEMDKATQFQKEVEQLRGEKQDLIDRLKAVQNDPKKKEQELKRKQENEALKDRLEHLETERKQAEGSRNYAEQTARGVQQRVTDLQERVKSTTRQYQNVKEAHESTNEKLRQANALLAAQKEEIDKVKTQLKQITSQPGFVTGAEQGRRDLDLSIQLEMAREENQKMQQKLTDTRMLHERSTDSAKQLARDKQDLDDALRRVKEKHRETQSQLAAMTSRADRLKEMSHKLQSKTKRRDDDDQPSSSGKRSHGQSSHGTPTPRKSVQPVPGLGGRKRSMSNDGKLPSYAKPTSAWNSHCDEDSLPGGTPTASPLSSSLKMNTPRKRKPDGKKGTPTSPSGFQNGLPSPRGPIVASPRGAPPRAKRSISEPRSARTIEM